MKSKSCGQATVEYIFVLAFAIIFGFNILNRFTDFFRDSMGGVGHALSTNLTIGVCNNECWVGTDQYANGFTGGQ
jgi:hypothetical protein